MSFETASRFEQVEPGLYTGFVDATWYQGRGVYGGLVAAILVRAFENEVGDSSRLLRTLTVHFCAPVVAEVPVDVQVRVERVGRYVTQVTGRMVQGGETVATSTATLGADRPGSASAWLHETVPYMPPLATSAIAPDLPLMPDFTRFVQYRYCVGGVPFSGHSEAEIGGWCRFREPVIADTAMFAALLDVWPPAVSAMANGLTATASSVDLSYHFLQPLPLSEVSATEEYFMVSRSRAGVPGYAEEQGELWTRDGRLVARTRQWVAIFTAR
jgi:acyl-CoA thioesterase